MRLQNKWYSDLMLVDHGMVYIADEGGKQRGADVGSKEVMMVYMRRLEHVASGLYSS